MTGTIIFNGTSSQDFNLIVEKVPSSVHASRRGNLISIPGRNGVIVREDGSFDTYTQEYDIWFSESENDCGRSTYDVARDTAVWLLGASGFCRLEDDFEPGYYRMARYSGTLDVDMLLVQCGKAKLTFDVQPQRFLKSGETRIKYTRDSTASSEYGAVFEITNLPEEAAHVKLSVNVSGTQTPDGELYIMSTESEETSVQMHVRQTSAGYEIYGEADIPADSYGAKARYLLAGDADATATVYDSDGDEILKLVGIQDQFTVENQTQFEARPLLKFTGSPHEQPDPDAQTLTMRQGYKINKYGGIERATATESHRYAVSNAVSVSGYTYAYITGSGYAFMDSNNAVIQYIATDRVKLSNRKIQIPKAASSVVVASGVAETTAALSLQGSVAVEVESATINGTTITLDYTNGNTIYLDCDLHDAYYEDGSNANGAVSFASNLTDYPTFPGFEPGENIVSVPTEGSVEVEIEPRWWTL